MSDEVFDMYGKSKRKVNPNAAPRPNLMTHEVKLRSAQQTIEDQTRLITMLQIRVDELERKMRSQADYLAHLHNVISRK